MAWPMLSLWCDSRAVTDPNLLVQIAGFDPDVATGVLTNSNITGADLATVLDRASLAWAKVSEAGPAVIMGNRSAEDQVRILVAAARKSVDSANELLTHACPEAALQLLRAPLRGARAEDLRRQVLDYPQQASYRSQAGKPGYRELAERAADRGVNLSLLLNLAAGAETDADLLTLTDRFALVDTEDILYGEQVIDQLLATTYGHPEVVRAWVAGGSDLAAVVAAADHRQDAQFIRDLTVTAPQLTTLLTQRRVNNPAVAGSEAAVDQLVQLARTALTLPDREDRAEAVEAWREMAILAIEADPAEGEQMRAALATRTPNDAVTGLPWSPDAVPTLLWLDLIKFKPGWHDYDTSWEVWDHLGQVALPPRVREHVISCAPHTALQDSSWDNALRCLGYQPEPDEDEHADPGTAAGMRLSTLHLAPSGPAGYGGYHVPVAAYVAGRLRTAEQWRKLYERAGRSPADQLGEVITAIVGVKVTETPYAQLLGNALGILD